MRTRLGAPVGASGGYVMKQKSMKQKLSLQSVVSSLSALSLSALLLLSAFSVHADEFTNEFTNEYSNEYFTLKQKSVSITEVPIQEEEIPSSETFKLPAPLIKSNSSNAPFVVDADQGILFDKIVNYFFKFWDLLDRNRPSVSVNSKYANAVPEGIGNSWDKMSGWRPERSFRYQVIYENGFGAEAVNLTYQVKLIYGGSVQGRGFYIASARAVPVSVKVLSGFNVDVNVEASNVWNAGSSEDPVAALQLDVTWMVKSILKLYVQTESYHLQGDGKIMNANAPRVLFDRDYTLTH